jgi:spermidine/putrescine transport system ATP-binding protein
MSDRIAVMSNGRIEQLGSPTEVYEEPVTAYVADFLGVSNLMDAQALGRSGDVATVKLGDFEVSVEKGDLDITGDSKIVIRPERVRVEDPGATGRNRIPAMVERLVYLGATSQLFIRLPMGDTIQVLTQNAAGRPDYQAGAPVTVFFPPEAVRVVAPADVPPIDDQALVLQEG